MLTLSRAAAAALAILSIAACAGDADTDAGATGDSAANRNLAGNDSLSVSGFSTPESVLHDEAADVYLVSNINGSPLDKDDNGFISRVAPDGSVQSLKWIDGATDQVMLNAPKGLAIVGDTLFVADIDHVRAFHRTTGAPLGERAVPGATFLNDLASGPDGTLYVSDSGLKPDFTSSGTDAVYRFENGRPVAIVKGTDKLHGPNGLAANADGLFLVPFNGKSVYRIGPDGEMTEVAQLPNGGLDGIVQTGTGWMVSSWEGQIVFRLDAQTPAAPTVTAIESPADIGYDVKRGRVLIPVFNQNKLEIRKR